MNRQIDRRQMDGYYVYVCVYIYTHLQQQNYQNFSKIVLVMILAPAEVRVLEAGVAGVDVQADSQCSVPSRYCWSGRQVLQSPSNNDMLWTPDRLSQRAGCSC